MKKKIFLSAFAALVFAACSADSISNADAENWPSDFSAKEYAELNWELVTVQMRDAVAEKNSEKGKTLQDIDEKETNTFFDKEASVKEIFTKYAGFADTIWPGFEELKTSKIYSDFRDPLFEYHAFGNTASKDLDFLKSFEVNYDVLKMQYVMIGRIEGRAYRYCKDGEAKQLQVADESQAVAVRSKWDFSANTYCKNKKDGQIYLIP